MIQPTHAAPLMQPSLSADSPILVVDDEPANLLLMQRVLVRQGYRAPITVADPLEALRHLDEEPPALVLLDLHMPGMSGMELLARIRERVPDPSALPIVVLTADVTREVRQAALAAGASDFLTKPVDPLEMGLRIRNLLEVRRLHQSLRAHGEALETAVQERTRELAEALRELEVANRSKDEFLANMSHELRTPLTAIGGALSLLERQAGGTLPDAYRGMLQLASRNADRLLRLINGILELQALRNGSVRCSASTVELHRLLGSLVDEFLPSAREARVQLRLDLPPGRATVRSDGDLLRDALRPLVENAIRFTPRGAVALRLHLGPAPCIEVRDTGIGIAAVDQARVMEPFQQASTGDGRSHGGVGMGLTLARELCALLQCRIEIESEPGRGTLVRLLLPKGSVTHHPAE